MNFADDKQLHVASGTKRLAVEGAQSLTRVGVESR